MHTRLIYQEAMLQSFLLMFGLLASFAASGVIHHERGVVDVEIDDAYSLPDMEPAETGLEARDDPGGFDDQFRDPGEDNGSEDQRRTNCIGDFCPSKYGCMVAPYILDGFYLKQIRTELQQFCSSGTTLVRVYAEITSPISSANYSVCAPVRERPTPLNMGNRT